MKMSSFLSPKCLATLILIIQMYWNACGKLKVYNAKNKTVIFEYLKWNIEPENNPNQFEQWNECDRHRRITVACVFFGFIKRS